MIHIKEQDGFVKRSFIKRRMDRLYKEKDGEGI